MRSCLIMVTIKYLLLIAIFLILDIVWSKQDDIWTDSQTDSKSRIQQLRQFEKIHRAQTNNTQPTTTVDLDADYDPSVRYPILTLENISTSIITMSVDVKRDFNGRFFSNAYVLTFVRDKYIYYIKRGRVYKADPILTWLSLLLNLEYPLSQLNRIVSDQETHIVFNIWNPFQSGIVGFGINEKTASFNLIYQNETSHIDTTNQDIIAYIQENFLQVVADDIPDITRDGFIALMFFTKINDSSNGVGFRFPQYCNHNGVTPLKVYFDSLPKGNWTDFGSFHIPNDTSSYSACLNERMSYINFNASVNTYYKSYEKTKYCPPTAFRIGSYMVEFELTAHLEVRLPKSLCIDNELILVYAECEVNNSFTFSTSPYNLMDISSLITNETLMMYKPIANMHYGDYSNPILQLNSQTTYIDVYLYFLNLIVFDIQIGGLVEVFNEGVRRLKSQQIEDSLQISHLAILARIFMDTSTSDYLPSNGDSSTILYESITNNNKNKVGIAMYNDNIIKPLMYNYPTDNFIIDDNIDVIVKLSDKLKPDKFDIRILIFTDEFYYKQSNFSETKIIGIINMEKTDDYDEMYLDIHLKVCDGNNNGFWSPIRLARSMVFVFISKSNQDVCGSKLMWNMLHVPVVKQPGLTRTYNTEMKLADILSHLSVLLNTRASRNYYKNFNILTGIKIITSILSITGISCIFVTCLLFKGWLKQRIYTNQLCISLLIQAIFFLLNRDFLNHTALIFFYYSILTQFMWMAFVSYVQYVRFIFGTSHLSLTKTLIFGWGVPALIIITSIVMYKDCLKCKFCYRNDEIFQYFVILPITIIITCNICVYIAVRINMWKNKIEESSAKYRIRAIVAIPFVLGLLWIVLASVMAPSLIVSLVAWYLFYFIIPSQGFILFIFMILLDKETRHKWFELLIITYYRCLSIFRG